MELLEQLLTSLYEQVTRYRQWRLRTVENQIENTLIWVREHPDEVDESTRRWLKKRRLRLKYLQGKLRVA